MLQRWWRRIVVLCSLGVVALVGLRGPSAAADPQAHSLDGTCTLVGRISFDHPVGLAPRQVGYADRASGTCTGTVDGVYRTNTPVKWTAKGSGMIGCSVARTMSAGTLTFPVAHARIRVTTRGIGTLVEIAATFKGRVSGTGVVDVILQGSQSATAACAAGTLTSIGEQLAGRTLTPVVD